MPTYPMRLRRYWLCASVALLGLAAQGCTSCCPAKTTQPAGNPTNVVIQEFPAGGPMETAWRVQFAHADGKGLYITGAWFKRAAGEDWMRVLWDARLVELFVPYHSGSPRYYDLTGFGFPLVDATQDDAGCCGEVLEGKVVKEVRDRGVAWKDDAAVHRGQALVLWATLDAANYNYIIEYGFSDDGTISYRLGATARNLPGSELEAHMHNGLWRIDIDLDGFPNDSAMLMRHVEPIGGDTATDPSQPFGGGIEGAAEWNDLEFTHLHIGDSVTTNKHGHHIGYDLMPIRHGTARHSEAFTQHDFWVTRYHPTELLYPLVPPTFIDYRNGESVTDTDVVLWHISSAHHLPRDEDGEIVGDVWQGSALVMWYGFDMRPRDLFDNTPLHP